MSNITRFQFEQMQARLNRPEAKPEPPLEKALHAQIMDYCDAQWPRWKYIHSRMDKSTRNQLGVPDFAIYLPETRFMLVECKRPGEKLSMAQQGWIAEVNKLKIIVHIVHDIREFLLAVETTMKVGQPQSNPPPT
jgi:hypothetical protein